MALNCVLHMSHGEDVIRSVAMIHALAARPSSSRGNYLKNNPDFNPFSVSRWLQADPRSCMPQALDKAEL